MHKKIIHSFSIFNHLMLFFLYQDHPGFSHLLDLFWDKGYALHKFPMENGLSVIPPDDLDEVAGGKSPLHTYL